MNPSLLLGNIGTSQAPAAAPPSGSETRQKPCFAFRGGHCAYAQNCQYSHDIVDQFCKDFLRGKCAYGTQCKFYHDLSRLVVDLSRHVPALQQAVPQLGLQEPTMGVYPNQHSAFLLQPQFPRFQGDVIHPNAERHQPQQQFKQHSCRFYSRTGLCKFGDACRFSHAQTNPLNASQFVPNGMPQMLQLHSSSEPPLANLPSQSNDVLNALTAQLGSLNLSSNLQSQQLPIQFQMSAQQQFQPSSQAALGFNTMPQSLGEWNAQGQAFHQGQQVYGLSPANVLQQQLQQQQLQQQQQVQQQQAQQQQPLQKAFQIQQSIIEQQPRSEQEAEASSPQTQPRFQIAVPETESAVNPGE